MGHNHKARFKIRKVSQVNNPFRNIDCSCDGVLHQQFSLRATFNNPSISPLIIYSGSIFGSPTANLVRDTNNGMVFPRGTVIARNLSSTPFTYSVFGGSEDVKTLIVPPHTEVTITSDAIREVKAFSSRDPNEPIRAIFTFDIFFPAEPNQPE